MAEWRHSLNNDQVLIRTEEGIWFSQIGNSPPLLIDEREAADLLAQEVVELKRILRFPRK